MRHSDSFGTVFFSAVILALILMLAIVLTPLILICVPVYIGYRLYRDSPARAERIAREETRALYQHAVAGSVTLEDEEIMGRLMAEWPEDVPDALAVQLLEIGEELYAAEGLSLEVPPPPALHNSIEAARYRDQLARIGQAQGDKGVHIDALAMISSSLAAIARLVPPMDGDTLVEVTQFAHPLGQVVQDVLSPFFTESDYVLFKGLREKIDANLLATHRTNPVFPTEYKGDDVVDTYLSGTPLARLFQLRTPFVIPEKSRFEHLHMVAGSGHGKTQTLQYLIANDIQDVLLHDKSVVVIDSQGDLINTILKARHLPPDRIVLIDPEDIAWPVSLNLFSVGRDRLGSYDALEQERLSNSIIELYDFVLGSLLAAGMTAKQSVVFRYVTRLMFHIPDATIHTLRELMEPNGSDAYAEHIQKLQGTARRFFETEFNSKEFASTKTQVLRRLYGVLENQTFERMFTNPESKFDMFTEMNAGKLILINTSKSLLKEQGTEIFGRFFIALITQAAQERATLSANERLPVMVYIDEAQDYFDQNIGIILSQARKYNVGMVMAHQFLGQLSNGLQEAFEANTSIKLAGGVSARDARALAGQMSAEMETIQRQPKGTFATYIRGVTDRAVPISFPFFVLENAEPTTKEKRDAIRQHSREAYAEPLMTKAENCETKPEKNDSTDPEIDPDDPRNPSGEL